MPRSCTICGHAARTEIDKALAGGASNRSLASLYGVSIGALRRHWVNHVGETLCVDCGFWRPKERFSARMWRRRRDSLKPACIECANRRHLTLALDRAMERIVNESWIKRAQERAEQWRAARAQYMAQLPESQKRRIEANRAIYRLKKKILIRDGHVCGICGEAVRERELSIDHIAPISAGGSDDITNLQPSHKTCNSRKGGKSRAPQLLDLPASGS